jgi:hypothetical protein
MKTKSKHLEIIALVTIIGLSMMTCANSATAKNAENIGIEYPKWPDNLTPFFDETTGSKVGLFYKDLGRGIETSRIFSTPNSNKPSLVGYLLTSTSFPNFNSSATFELISISGEGGIIIGKCISCTGMAQSDYKKGQIYTLCDSYEIIGKGVGAELTLTGGKMGSNITCILIQQ